MPDTSSEGRATRWIGRIVDDRYRIIELIGEGGMGAVFVAEHLKLRKSVAIKTIRPDLASRSSGSEAAGHSHAEARFAREALATAQLDHPHIASAIDYGHLPEGGAYLVTQLVRGHSLTSRLQKGPLSWLEACRVGSQVADALTAAHALGIIHRDLKPDNILLETRDDGLLHARVVDFGVARMSDDGDRGRAGKPITRIGAVIGTPGYMAPEQAVGEAVDLRADLYALGVILWESCTGVTLWQDGSLTELYARQLSQPAPSLRTALPGDVPLALASLVDQLLARNPDERPASAAVVRDELRRLVLTGEVHLTMHPSGLGPTGTLAADGGTPVLPDISAPGLGPTDTLAVGSGSATASSAGGTPVSPAMSSPAPPSAVPTAIATRVAGPTTPVPQDSLPAAGATALAAPAAPVSPAPAPNPAAAARAIPRAARLGGLVVLVLIVVGVVVAARPRSSSKAAATAGAKDRSDRSLVDALVAEVPAAYADHARVLLASEDPRARDRAGAAIAGAPEADKPAIPEYIRNLAWLEHVSECADKKSILKKLAGENDPRALPALKIIAGAPPGDCKVGNMNLECIECLRDDLAALITRFERAASR